jgi:hypothetical protein
VLVAGDIMLRGLVIEKRDMVIARCLGSIMRVPGRCAARAAV